MRFVLFGLAVLFLLACGGASGTANNIADPATPRPSRAANTPAPDGETPVKTRVPTLDVMATATFFAEKVAETQTLEAQTPTDLPETEIPVPTDPNLPTDPPAPPTEPPIAVATHPPSSNSNEGPVGVCTTGCSVSTPPAGCLIKGNVNSDGEKIFHSPGQRDYKRTQIHPEQGDAWFCSAAEAVAAGFRAAQR